MKPSLPPDEEERLHRLQQLAILDTPAEAAFDRVVRLAQGWFDVPVAFVSFVDRDRQWFKSCRGFAISQTARDVAYCAHAILSSEVLVVPDTREDPRFADNLCSSGDSQLLFYAGAPILLPEGCVVGTVGVMDTKPRKISASDIACLQDLAAVVVDELQLRLLLNCAPTNEGSQLDDLPEHLRERFENWIEVRTAGWVSANTSLQAEVTQRKRIEAQLRASEKRYRQVINQSADAIVVADENGTVVEINPAAHLMLGYEREEIVGRHIGDFNLPEDRAEDEANLQLLASGESVLVERWMIRKDGSRLPVEVSVSPIGGGLIQATARNITERKRAQAALLQLNEELEARVQARTAELEEAISKMRQHIAERLEAELALQKSNHRLTTTLESISDGFYSMDKEWRLTYVNASAEKMIGKSREELMGHRLYDLFPELRDSVFWDFYRTTMEQGIPTTVEEYYKPLDCWYQVHCYPSSEGLTAYFQDITARKHAERALQEAKEAAERTSDAKTEFLSRMSHELRTPMNAILGFAQLFDLEEMTPDDRENIEQILHGGKHLLALINEVLDVARVESGKVTLSIEAVAVGEVTQEAIGLVQMLATGRGVQILNEVGSDGPYVLADRQRFKQVMLNLLSNAIKYNRDQGQVFVSCHANGEGTLRIEVRDTGRGMTGENLEKLFTPFERLGAEESDIEGTGIGLALSKRLVGLMSGAIGVSSERELGSTFWVELPATQPQELSETEVSESSGSAIHTVLYIEDNLSNLKLVERIMSKRADIKLIAAMQGGIGLDLAREHRPTLILLDVHLPDLPGHEVLRRLQASEDTRDIPVVVLSADATPKQVERLREAGARQYLTKPLNVRNFLTTLEEYLDKEVTTHAR